jgi:hypothetical protein
MWILKHTTSKEIFLRKRKKQSFSVFGPGYGTVPFLGYLCVPLAFIRVRIVATFSRTRHEINHGDLFPTCDFRVVPDLRGCKNGSGRRLRSERVPPISQCHRESRCLRGDCNDRTSGTARLRSLRLTAVFAVQLVGTRRFR